MTVDTYPRRDSQYRPKCPDCGAFCGVKMKDKTCNAGMTEMVYCENCGLGVPEEKD